MRALKETCIGSAAHWNMDNQGYEMSYQPAFHAYGNVLPLSVHPQWVLHPQSGLPDALAAAAPDALHAVGTHFGYPTTGLVAGHALAGAVRHIPFPQPPAHPFTPWRLPFSRRLALQWAIRTRVSISATSSVRLRGIRLSRRNRKSCWRLKAFLEV
jgi:hypothetical protein